MMITQGISNTALSGAMLGQEPVHMDDAAISAPSTILVTQSDPLVQASAPGSAKPETSLPSMVDVTIKGKALPGAKPTTLWSMEKLTTGRAMIELGDNYALGIDEANSEVVIANRTTQETTRVFGNAQVETAGQDKLQFWGTTTFELANGTKITANTVENPENKGAYMLDKLTVTNDYHALVITGVSDTKLGDLAVTKQAKTESEAYRIDDNARDGYVLVENKTGAGWVSEHSDKIATQVDMNETAVGADFAPGSSMMSLGEYGAFYSRIMTSLFTFTMAHAFSHASYDRIRDNNQSDHGRDDARKSDERSSLRQRLIELQTIRYAEMMPDVNDIARMEALKG
jgi:Domain of Unknown Function (DUF1521)